MYIPETFKETRPQVLQEFILANSFATLTTNGPAGMMASHLPFLVDFSRGEHGFLLCHMAKANPQWREFSADADVMSIFLGPHAYISPNLYESKMTVPTWNYTAVHVYGRPRVLSEGVSTIDVLKSTVKQHEGTDPGAWLISSVPEDYVSKLATQVVAFEIEISRIEGKFKLNQNRTLADQHRVVEVLSQAKDDLSRQTAAVMKSRLDEKAAK